MARHPLSVTVLVVVAVGGVVGACARFFVGEAFPGDATGFPWTTFFVNVTGSMVLALLPALAVVRRHPLLPPLLGTGVLGGFTTLSAYSEQARALAAEGAIGLAAAYVVATLAACLAAVGAVDVFVSRSARREFEDEEGDL